MQRLKTSADVTGAGCGPVFDSVVVLGPTACGKTSLAVHIARLFSGEIISADSRQVYRNLDIGTGKDLAEYGGIPYHLIDIISLPEEYNVFRFRKDFYSVLPEIQRRGKLPVLAGGTGLYLDSVIRNYDFTEVPENPELRLSLEKLDDKLLFERLSGLKTARGEKVHPDDTVDRERLIRAIEIAECSSARADTAGPSVRFNPFVLGIRFPREEIRARIKTRLDSRLNDGMVEEVEALHNGKPVLVAAGHLTLGPQILEVERWIFDAVGSRKGCAVGNGLFLHSLNALVIGGDALQYALYGLLCLRHRAYGQQNDAA